MNLTSMIAPMEQGAGVAVTGSARQPFLERPEVKAAIKQLAAADEVTLLIGSGLSVDQGLPRWDELVRKLIRDSSYQVEASVQQDFVEQLTRSGDLLAGGSWARALLGHAFLERVWHHLYHDEDRNQERPVSGGTFATTVAEFILSRLAETPPH